MARASLVNSSVMFEQLQGLEVGGLVELVVDGPDVVRVGGPQPGAVGDRDPHPGALLGLLEHAKSLVTAQSLDALVVDAVALPAQDRGHAPIAVAGVGPGQLSESGPEVLLFGARHRGGPALGGSGLADGPTRPTL